MILVIVSSSCTQNRMRKPSKATRNMSNLVNVQLHRKEHAASMAGHHNGLKYFLNAQS